jgi:hypothetical protein
MKYQDKYYLHRKLKPFVDIDSSALTIYLPQDMQLTNISKQHIQLLCNLYGYQVQTTIPCDKFEKVIFKRSLCIRSLKMSFEALKFAGITPGTKVVKIGAGGETKKNKFDKFENPYTYVGVIRMDEKKYFAFEIPENEKPQDDMKYYMLYSRADDGIGITKVIFKKNTQDYIRIYKPIFQITK